MENTERLLAQAPPLDFVIGSIHMLSERYDGMDLYFFDPPNEAEARRGMADYLGQVRKLAEWGKFSVLGHLTLPVRYLNENRGFHLTFDGFKAEMEEILRILIRLALLPLIAGVSYEIIRLAGRSDAWLICLLSKPGLWVQNLTTKEPDDDMIEVAIAAVEAVFDWRAFLEENFRDRTDPEREKAAG